LSDDVPWELARLNKYEISLISLRLPWIPIWQDRPGFSQYANKRTPVSYSNPVAQLRTLLPRDPNLVFKSILKNGCLISISSTHILAALKWLEANNPLYESICYNNNILESIQHQFSERDEDQPSEFSVESTPAESIKKQ